MANSTAATPNLLTDPGFLYYAPIGTSEPVGTVIGGVFADAWAAPWTPFGMTDTGSEFDPSLTTAPITAAESIDPLVYKTTDRATQIAFMLKNFSASHLSKALNGALVTVTGSGSTLRTVIDPPSPGQEIRCMLGWESLDSTIRYIAYQCLNSGSLKLAMAKAPANTSIPWTAQLEKPATSQPFRWIFAGAARNSDAGGASGGGSSVSNTLNNNSTSTLSGSGVTDNGNSTTTVNDPANTGNGNSGSTIAA